MAKIDNVPEQYRDAVIGKLAMDLDDMELKDMVWLWIDLMSDDALEELWKPLVEPGMYSLHRVAWGYEHIFEGYMTAEQIEDWGYDVWKWQDQLRVMDGDKILAEYKHD